MGASRLLVRLIERMRPCCRSLLEDEMIICCASGSDERARLTRAPSGGFAALFDIERSFRGKKEGAVAWLKFGSTGRLLTVLDVLQSTRWYGRLAKWHRV